MSAFLQQLVSCSSPGLVKLEFWFRLGIWELTQFILNLNHINGTSSVMIKFTSGSNQVYSEVYSRGGSVLNLVNYFCHRIDLLSPSFAWFYLIQCWFRRELILFEHRHFTPMLFYSELFSYHVISLSKIVSIS